MKKDLPILKSKLEIPNAQSRLLSRKHLTDILNQAFEYKTTLVSAPAGYGKTSTISEWARERADQVTWISLDKADNDPIRFYGYIKAAFKKLFSGLDDIEENISPYSSTPIQIVLGELLNALEVRDSTFFIVFEDYHCITDNAIHELLSFLIRYLPKGIHLIISTRHDPPIYLARSRIQNQLKEIHQSDLSFSKAEIGTFLNGIIGLDLSESDIIKITEKTEGWAAGVQILALALTNCENRSDFIADFSGSHSYIMNYMVTEVLYRQSTDIKRFLLQTSVLEHISGDLCDAVTQRKDSLSILEQLAGDNQFIVKLDNQRQSYRYHQLFIDVLRNMLKKEMPLQIPEIYQRAGQWYEKNNYLNEAINCAYKIGNISWAIKLIESYAKVVLRMGERTTVRKWMEKLTDQTIRSRPVLCLLSAWSLMNDKTSFSDHLFIRRLQDAENLLKKPEFDRIASSEDTSLSKKRISNTITILRAIFTFERGKPSEMFLDGLRKSLKQSENHMDDVYCTILFFIGHIQLRMGDLDSAFQSMDETVSVANAKDNLNLSTYATYLKAWIFLQKGKYHQAVHLCETYLAELPLVVQKKGLRPIKYEALNIIIGAVYIEWNRLSDADLVIEGALSSLKPSTEIGIIINGLIQQIVVKIALGKSFGEIKSLITRLESMSSYHRSILQLAKALQIKLSFQFGDISPILEDEERFKPYFQPDPEYFNQELSYYQYYEWRLKERLILIHLFLIRHARQAKVLSPEIISLLYHYLEEQQSGTEKWGMIRLQTEILVTTSILSEMVSKADKAQDDLKVAINLAASEGSLWVFIENGKNLIMPLKKLKHQGYNPDFINKILSCITANKKELNVSDDTARLQKEHHIERLSIRELDVLKLIAKGNSNRVISSQLFISLNTVKTHTSSIYHKLGVNNRTQAVSIAAKFGIL